MPKIIISVGQCALDSSSINRLITSLGAEMIKVDLHSDVPEAIRKHSPSLVLINRINDSDGSSGIDLIRELKSSNEETPLMLISNYKEAQAEAVALGAVEGFGKSHLASSLPAARLKKWLD